jgi:hypothetical protein
MSNIYGVSGQNAAAPSREQRAAMLLQVNCSVMDGAFFKIRVRNLSSHGLGGLCLQRVNLREGQSASIGFRNVSPISGQIIWVSGNEVGVRFDAPIDFGRIHDARNWNGPDFEINPAHEVAKRCYRPGVSNDF